MNDRLTIYANRMLNKTYISTIGFVNTQACNE